jgi:hypothetical protein
MSKYKRKSTIIYRIETEIHGSNRDYTTTHLRIQTMDEVKVSERIYWSCNNPDYYGPPERYQGLAAMGHEVYYELDFNSREVYLSYLHHDGHYCQHKAEYSGRLTPMKWAVALLTKISRERAKATDRYYGPKEDYSTLLDNPETVIETLKAMGAVEIEYTRGSVGSSAAVPRFSTPHTFLIESAA